MRYTLASFILLFLTSNVFSQLYYKRSDSIKVRENGDLFEYAYQGGYNSPQFNLIDLDFDNKMDLVIFDRSGGRISTYINHGTSGQIDFRYDPSYAAVFPEVSDWLFTRDYNCDGKMDLITGVRGSTVRVYENTGSQANGLSFLYVGPVQSTYHGNNFPLNINPGGANLPAIGDMNNDGDIDFLFFDQNGSQMEYHRNLSVENNGSCGLLFEERSECWGDFTEAGFNSTIYLDSCRFGNNIPNPESSGGSIRNLEGKTSSQKRHSKHAGSSVSMVDLGPQGSMDLVIGDVGGNNLTALFNDDSVAPYINSHIEAIDTLFPVYDIPVDLAVFPASFFIDVNNDQKEDMIVSTNSNGYLARSKYYNNVLYYENVGTSDNRFQYRLNNFIQGEVIDLGRGAYPTFFDYNGDGLSDILVGNDGYFDSTLNLIVGQLALFENVGTAQKAEYSLIDRDFGGLSSIPLDLTTNGPQRFLVPCVGDLDGDGDDDLLIGDDDGLIHYFIDTSSASSPTAFRLEAANFQGMNVFNRAAPFLIDVNRDSLLDLVIGNNLGDLEYHQNLGSTSEPIFNIEIQSILWQYDSILKYQFRGNPDLSSFQVGQTLDINNALNGNNNVFQIIASIDNAGKSMELIHPFTRSSIDDEVNSTAVVDYSIKMWGGIDLTQFNFDGNAAPFLYRNDVDELNMVIGGQNGYLYFYDQIDSNITGNFNLVDSVYTTIRYGANAAPGGADLDQDGNIDLAVGNEAGGFVIMMGSKTTSLEEFELAEKEEEGRLLIFPNPSRNQIQILLPENFDDRYDLRIYDLSGKLVREELNVNQRRYQLVHSLKPAMYLVEAAGSKKRLTTKLLVKP